MAGDELRTRLLTAGDLGRVLELEQRAFGPSSRSVDQYTEAKQPLVDAGRMLGVVAGNDVVAAAQVLSMHQAWGGRSVPMAGIAGVVVAPEHRGRGVGTMLMRATIQRARELGASVSALYPATVPIYRGLGWEVAGVRHRLSVPSQLLRGLGGRQVEVRRASADDAELVGGLERRGYERGRDSGPLLHSLAETTQRLDDPEVFSYVTDDGFVSYRWHRGDLLVHQLVAGHEETLRALWSVVGSGSSTAPTVHAYLGPRDPLHLLLPATVAAGGVTDRWMLRILDPAEAVAARGFPVAVTCELALRTTDREVSDASGTWLLRVADGVGALERTDAGAGVTELGARALAAVFAGTPMDALRRAGLAAGGSPVQDAALDAAFAGDAYLLDYF